MKKINKFCLVIVVLFMAFVFMGCQDDTTTKKQVTLTYAAWGDAAVEQAMLDAFMEKNPNINVILDTTITGTGSAFTENLVAAAQARIAPDVFVVDNVPTVIDRGLVYDVAEFWNADDDAKLVYENIATAALYGEKRLAVPSYQFIKGIFVNKTLLTNIGIEIPDYDWTWAEFYELCEEVNEVGNFDGKPIAAINGYYGELDWEKTMACQDDDTIGYATWNGTRFNFENENWIKYRKLTDTFYDTGLLEQMTEEDKLQFWGSETAYPFGEGCVAFGVEGSWNAQATVDSFTTNGYDVEFYPYPAGANGQQEPVILDFMCVSSQTSFPAEAYELLKWMSYGREGWATRLNIMQESKNAIDRYPVADYPEIWTDLNEYMAASEYEGMAATIKIIGNGIPDCDKWLPGYSTFWTYIAETEEDRDWYNMDVDQLAREWTTLINKYVDDEYTRLGLEK